MERSRLNVLIIAPYTKRFGIAVFRDSKLLYFSVKTFRLPRTAESVKMETSMEIENLIQEFSPNLVIVKALTERQIGSDNQRQVTREVRRLANIAAVPIKVISFEDVKRKVSSRNRPTKMSTFRVLKGVYPELARFIQFQNRSQEEYYTPLLSSIAIGLVHQNISLKDSQIF
jgi:hypothetical protein